MTLIPMVLEYTMVVSEYLETKYSDFIMVSAIRLGSEDIVVHHGDPDFHGVGRTP